MMKSILTLAFVVSCSNGFAADPTCEAYPKCGAFTCENYYEGEWKDPKGTILKGVFLSYDDAKNYQLFQTNDGYIDGNVVRVLAECKF